MDPHVIRFRDGRPHYVVDGNGCWLWQGCLTRGGYGNLRVAGRTYTAHRWYYEQAHGPLAAGMGLEHTCAVRHCVNPSHLEAVPTNVRKAKSKQGERNPQWRGAQAGSHAKHSRATRNIPLDGLCRVCAAAAATDRHHIDGDPGNNSSANVLSCCRRCHMQLDGRLTALKTYPRAQGERNPHSKPTAAQVAEMRSLQAAGWTLSDLARRYGMTKSGIGHICRRETWRHV